MTPSLAEDEQRLAELAAALADGIETAVPDWIRGSIAKIAAEQYLSVDPGQVEAAVAQAQSFVDDTTELLTRDIADQHVGPLQVLRDAVLAPTKVLAEAGAAAAQRDPFEVQAFPEDIFGLSPATFGEISEELQQLGLTWGAAKAHVHLRRRREAEQAEQADQREQSEPLLVALVVDLMDKSKIDAAHPGAEYVRNETKLVERVSDYRNANPQADIGVIIDLSRLKGETTIGALVRLDAAVVAFGSHVDSEALDNARAQGAMAVPRSLFFRRLNEAT